MSYGRSRIFLEDSKLTEKIFVCDLSGLDKSNLVKVQEDQFLDEFLPKLVCSNANCEVVDKNGSIKGYITQKELSKALTKEHMDNAVKSSK